jgi:hypothetical protein
MTRIGDRSDPGEINRPSARDQPDYGQADGQKQQMHWSPTGAQLFLRVRTAVLNNDLAGCFRRWYPGFTHGGGPAEIEAEVTA